MSRVKIIRADSGPPPFLLLILTLAIAFIIYKLYWPDEEPETAPPTRPFSKIDYTCTMYPISDDEGPAGPVLPLPARSAMKGRGPPRPKRTASFADNNGIAATGIANYSQRDPSSSIHPNNAELEGAEEHERNSHPRDAAKVRLQFGSRLPHFEQALSGHPGLVDGMKDVEGMMFGNWLSKSQEPGWDDQCRRACEDQWNAHSRWGKLPLVMLSLCQAMVQAIDISALAEAMKAVPEIYNSAAIPAKGIIEQLPSPQAQVDLLLGWFALPYRGYMYPQWTKQHKRSQTGCILHPQVQAAMGETGSELLLWLSWAGQRYLVNRMFTPAGADLLDGSARVSISRVQEDSDATFKLDVTLFTPASGELAEGVKCGAHWLKWSRVDKWLGGWLKEAICIALYQGQNWIDEKFDSEASKVYNGRRDFDRLALRRLFIRPGYANSLVDRSQGYTLNLSKPSLFRRYIDERTSTLVELDEATFLAAKNHPAAGGPAIADMIKLLHFSLVRFVNLRQNSWHRPEEGEIPADHFDARQVAYMLGIICQGFDTWKTDDYRKDVALVQATTSNRYPWVENTHIDFGGLMPFFPVGGFNFPLYFKEAGAYYIPLMVGQEVPILAHPDLRGGVKPESRHLTDTAMWLIEPSLSILPAMQTKKITIAVVMSTSAECAILHLALDRALGWITKDMAAEERRHFITVAIEALHSVKYTNIAQCQTQVDEATLWSLEYAPDSAKTNELMAGHTGNRTKPIETREEGVAPSHASLIAEVLPWCQAMLERLKASASNLRQDGTSATLLTALNERIMKFESLLSNLLTTQDSDADSIAGQKTRLRMLIWSIIAPWIAKGVEGKGTPFGDAYKFANVKWRVERLDWVLDSANYKLGRELLTGIQPLVEVESLKGGWMLDVNIPAANALRKINVEFEKWLALGKPA